MTRNSWNSGLVLDPFLRNSFHYQLPDPKTEGSRRNILFSLFDSFVSLRVLDWYFVQSSCRFDNASDNESLSQYNHQNVWECILKGLLINPDVSDCCWPVVTNMSTGLILNFSLNTKIMHLLGKPFIFYVFLLDSELPE